MNTASLARAAMLASTRASVAASGVYRFQLPIKLLVGGRFHNVSPAAAVCRCRALIMKADADGDPWGRPLPQ